MQLFLMGYPGDLGGACTEAWHTVKLWRNFGVDVHLIPTWHAPPHWRKRLDDLGCVTHQVTPDALSQVPGLAGSIVVGFCNDALLTFAARLRQLDCKIVWANCMTWLFDAEKRFYADHGPFDAYMFQSEFQRGELEPLLAEYGYEPKQGFLIRGAFDVEEWHFQPRPHMRGEPFFVGRVARPDQDKWSSNTWPIYSRIQYANKRALMLGMDERTHQKLGEAPPWADCLSPMALPAHDFYRQLHATLPVNGGARENWPRAGLEAMAAGVPVVAQNAWGWREMIVHGETGFLGDCDEELAHYTAVLAYDEELRLHVADNARRWLARAVAPDHIWSQWQQMFESINEVVTSERP